MALSSSRRILFLLCAKIRVPKIAIFAGGFDTYQVQWSTLSSTLRREVLLRQQLLLSLFGWIHDHPQ